MQRNFFQAGGKCSSCEVNFFFINTPIYTSEELSKRIRERKSVDPQIFDAIIAVAVEVDLQKIYQPRLFLRVTPRDGYYATELRIIAAITPVQENNEDRSGLTENAGV